MPVLAGLGEHGLDAGDRRAGGRVVKALLELFDLAAEFVERRIGRLLVERGVDLLGELGDEMFERAGVDGLLRRGAAFDSLRQRFVHLLDALVEFVEALAAGLGENVVELLGEMFEPLIERVEAIAGFRRDDRTDGLDGLANVFRGGARRADEAQGVDALREVEKPRFDLLERQGARGERRQKIADFAGLAGEFPERRGIAGAGRLQFVEPAADGFNVGVQIAHDRARIEFLDDGAQFAGDTFDRREQIIVNALIALRVDAMRQVAQGDLDRDDRGARREIAQGARQALDLAAQAFDLPHDDELLVGAPSRLAPRRLEFVGNLVDGALQRVETRLTDGVVDPRETFELTPQRPDLTQQKLLLVALLLVTLMLVALLGVVAWRSNRREIASTDAWRSSRRFVSSAKAGAAGARSARAARRS